MKIPATFNGVIDYRLQDYVYEMRRSLRQLVYKHRRPLRGRDGAAHLRQEP